MFSITGICYIFRKIKDLSLLITKEITEWNDLRIGSKIAEDRCDDPPKSLTTMVFYPNINSEIPPLLPTNINLPVCQNLRTEQITLLKVFAQSLFIFNFF